MADFLCKELKKRLAFAGQLRIRSKKEGAAKTTQAMEMFAQQSEYATVCLRNQASSGYPMTYRACHIGRHMEENGTQSV